MQLKVVSFNIRCCDDKNGHAISERAPRLHAAIAPIHPDVIGLQEYTPKWQPFIAQYFGKEYAIYNKYRARLSRESAPILWRKDKFVRLKTGHFWLSDTPEKQSRGWDERYNCYRICEYVILCERKSGKTFTFMNTHFGFGDKGQVASAKLIYDYSRRISAHPTFVTGDFNMLPDSPGYQQMAALFTDVNAATRNDLSQTYHAYQPETRPLAHIDYCFVDSQIKPLDQKIIRTTVDGKYPSDHYGLEIDIEL